MDIVSTDCKLHGFRNLKYVFMRHEMTKPIKENLSIDWELRNSARAKMRITVRRLLKKYGYPPDLQKLAVDTVVSRRS